MKTAIGRRSALRLAGGAGAAGLLAAGSRASAETVTLTQWQTNLRPPDIEGITKLIDRFHALNAAYRERFGFPFIICVRLTNKAGILAAMQRRLANDRDAEIAEALAQIGEIVRLRLETTA